MRHLTFIFVCLITISCNNKKKSEYKLDAVKKDMTMMQVARITGQPTLQEDMGSSTNETGDTTHIIIWHYGNNESVTFINGLVDFIDIDIKSTQERLQHIMDSAKAVPD